MRAKTTTVLTILLAAALSAGCGGGRGKTSEAPSHGGGEKQIAGGVAAGGAGEAPAVAEQGEDVLTEVLAANGKGAPPPPTGFRPGHATPRQLEAKRIAREGSGFRVSLPSGAPIQTPAVHGGLVLVGGGFRSREFYAFNATSGDLAWALDLDDDGPSSAVAEDGVVVFNTESCTVFAVDARTGRHLWSWWLGDPLTSTPTIANGMVFTSYPAGGHSAQQGLANQMNSNHLQQNVVPQQVPQPTPQVQIAGDEEQGGEQAAMPAHPYTHVLAAFDLKTGKILWQRWIDSDVMSAPVAAGDEVIAATFSGTVYKLDQRTGEVLSARRSRATSAPVIAGGDMYFTQRADNGEPGQAAEAVAAQDSQTWGARYQGQSKTARYLEAEVQEKAAYKAESQMNDAANGFGGGAPSAANPQAAHGNVGQGNVSSMQAFQGSRILNRGDDNYATMGDEIVCTDARTGKKRWSRKLEGDLERQGGFLGTSPAAAGDSLFVATLEGEVLRIDAKTGRVKKTYKVGSPVRTQPAIVDGRLYVGTTDGKLVVIDTGDRSLTGWTAWGGDAQHSGTVE